MPVLSLDHDDSYGPAFLLRVGVEGGARMRRAVDDSESLEVDGLYFRLLPYIHHKPFEFLDLGRNAAARAAALGALESRRPPTAGWDECGHRYRMSFWRRSTWFFRPGYVMGHHVCYCTLLVLERSTFGAAGAAHPPAPTLPVPDLANTSHRRRRTRRPPGQGAHP